MHKMRDSRMRYKDIRKCAKTLKPKGYFKVIDCSCKYCLIIKIYLSIHSCIKKDFLFTNAPNPEIKEK